MTDQIETWAEYREREQAMIDEMRRGWMSQGMDRGMNLAAFARAVGTNRKFLQRMREAINLRWIDAEGVARRVRRSKELGLSAEEYGHYRELMDAKGWRSAEAVAAIKSSRRDVA